MRSIKSLIARMRANTGKTKLLPETLLQQETDQVERLRLDILSVKPHRRDAYTQGFVWWNGSLYESTGGKRRSTLRQIDPQTGKVLRQIRLEDEYFGEGLALIGNKFYQITWYDQTALIYDRDTLELARTISYKGEGWGLCSDGKQLFMTDGSPIITVRDPGTFTQVKRILVMLNGHPLEDLNDLESVDNCLYANVWHTDNIIRIDKATGQVIAVINAAGLLKPDEIAAAGDQGVLNGIAYDPERQTFWITGKFWPWMFEVRFV
jgi:glutaminyl-peptide cyclotransferase